MEPQNNNPLFIPLSIVAAGAIIAGAIIFTANPKAENLAASPAQAPISNEIKVNPISKTDHILGNPKADIFVIEYSDLECPFCKKFHETMKRVVEEYSAGGRVAWVYRHFPLDTIHPTARKEAEASECAAELGGKAKFWEFVDGLFEITQSRGTIELALLSNIAEDIGLSRSAFEKCLASGKHANRVEKDTQDALKAGGNGTPYSVLLTKDGKTTSIPGAVPFESIKSTIDELLKTL